MDQKATSELYIFAVLFFCGMLMAPLLAVGLSARNAGFAMALMNSDQTTPLQDQCSSKELGQ